MARRTKRAGFSLLELLIVASLMAIIAAAVIPSANPGIHEQLDSVAQLLAGDIAYARSLAVTNNSKYKITFDVSQNRYLLEHSGNNTALDNLPASPFRKSTDPADQQIVRLAELPRVAAPVRILAVCALGTPIQTIADLEFGPLGETTRADESVIWLAAGSDSATRYISIRVSPVSGLCWIEDFRDTAPPLGAMSSVMSSSS